MNRIKKNDIVTITSGKDKGKTGKVLKVYQGEESALVEGINLVKKHMRRTRDDQQGGIISLPRPVAVSNIMPFCKACSRPVKISFSLAKDNTKIRICRKCKQAI